MPAIRDFDERQDHSVRAIVHRAIRRQPHGDPAATLCRHLALDSLLGREHAARVVHELRIGEPIGHVTDLPSDVGLPEVEQCDDGGREAPDHEVAIEEDRGHVGRIDQILEVRIQLFHLLDLAAVFLIERAQLLVDRLDLFLAGLELLARGMLLFVDRLQFLVRRLEPLHRQLVVFRGHQELGAQALVLLIPQRTPGRLVGGQDRIGR